MPVWAAGTGPLPPFCMRMLLRVLCRVTGDMDGVYLTDLAGRALPEAKRIAVYNKLMDVGWQHPETLTRIKDGLFDFDSKTKILKGLELGGEPMMEFARSCGADVVLLPEELGDPIVLERLGGDTPIDAEVAATTSILVVPKQAPQV